MAAFKKIPVHEWKDNVFFALDKEWMLITAGPITSFNTMTASWGGFGILWHKPIAVCFVRPTRFTYRFMENSDIFTLSFFAKKHQNALSICGTQSGRDGNKVREAGLTPVEIDERAVTFSQARLVHVCRKIYFHDLRPERFLDPAIESNYPEKDYHRMYVGEIVATFDR